MTTETETHDSTAGNGVQPHTPGAHEALRRRFAETSAILRTVGEADQHPDTGAALRRAAEYLRPQYAAEVLWLAELHDSPLGRVWLNATGLRLSEYDALAEVVAQQMQEGAGHE